MTESTDESSDLIIHLFRYQMKWLSLALKQERSVSNGGILADGMGLGETIQATALVLAKRELQQMWWELTFRWWHSTVKLIIWFLVLNINYKCDCNSCLARTRVVPWIIFNIAVSLAMNPPLVTKIYCSNSMITIPFGNLTKENSDLTIISHLIHHYTLI